ncbi:MAG: hypothetical protein F4120_08585 [Rhodothermaceae bacterium]|nr:hypothetical protein [Rhodothermaceae bacterium]MYC04376.1 hypothetical protein [Rhodothermaceae bacterium]MYI17663.1 hypothetical protein [Rhodothermaceae bacterium]
MKLADNKYWLAPPLIGLLILTGCRTYGGSTDEQIAASVLTATQQVAAEASRIEVESAMLMEAAVTHPELIPFSERMQVIVGEYMEMKEKQKKLTEEVTSIRDNFVTNWVGQDRHRALHRALGAIISERELKQHQIELIAQDLGRHLGVTAQRQSAEEGRLQIRPHHYNRSWPVTELQDLLTDIESEPAE